ncbi:hypothetical protein [Aeromonas cavernicola]|uniref:Uncharacterized protein n=1 Tax=Aeromonas cavernicola TaxID=1006623 RepID=A0A2H9U0G0_9GAMM|nr:hypothetical protein [Aeromonas cavernicola]PJG57532.1 hypothetical protein CUC53_17510 [Aeromonas cavernicola]
MKNDEKVVSAIFEELFFDNLPRYKNLLSGNLSVGSDAYSKASCVISNLGNEERDAIFSFLKLVIADTASVIFGTVDGSHFPNGIIEDFKLMYGTDEIQGCLQDYFIAQAEAAGTYK